MQFSRTHAGMLAVVSIFTGLIAPIASYEWEKLPLPLTDMQWIAYVLFLLLIVIFYIVSIGRWEKLGFYGYSAIGLIVMVFGFTYTDSLRSIKTDLILTDFSWGWIFLIAWITMLISVMTLEYDSYPAITPFSDKIIWLLWSGTLLILSLIVISISFSWPKGYESKDILSSHFESGSIKYVSGIALSPAFDTIENLTFKRKRDALSFIAKIWDTVIEKNDTTYFGNKKVEYLSGNAVIIDGKLSSEKILQYWSDDEAIILHGDHSLTLLSAYTEKQFTWAMYVSSIIKDESNKTLAWIEKTDEWLIIKRNGEILPGIFTTIDRINLSPSGYDVMAKATRNWKVGIFKNGTNIWDFKTWYVTGSYQSNGSHFIYTVREWDIYRIVYDGIFISGKYEEIREIFLEKSGNSYAFFGRPLWEKKYCLFTRYRGNICGIEGYMNPRLSADGGSVLYAAMIDGNWHIMRNTSSVTKNTGYTKTNIQHDYAFFDVTNPRQFVFISQEEDGTYTLIKNGKKLPGSWQDVWLDVQFWYDNKMIMTAKSNDGWHIIEF